MAKIPLSTLLYIKQSKGGVCDMQSCFNAAINQETGGKAVLIRFRTIFWCILIISRMRFKMLRALYANRPSIFYLLLVQYPIEIVLRYQLSQHPYLCWDSLQQSRLIFNLYIFHIYNYTIKIHYSIDNFSIFSINIVYFI